MCGAARYYSPEREKPYAIGYGYPEAAMPVLRPEGVEWIKWGRRKGQVIPGLPVTGWATLATLEAGGWDKYKPDLVELAVQEFGEKDGEGNRHWFKVPEGKHVQALVAHSTQTEDARLYVVTVPTPEEFSHIHDRWPRIV
jgi:hypothetical protein